MKMSKKNFINRSHYEGYLYEHKLERKVTGENSKNPGTEYIRGSISIATDEELLNVVQIDFSYATATTGSGKPNATYDVLADIIDGNYKTVMGAGKENATKLRVDSAIGLNEWYDTRTQGTPLISVKRNDSGFIHTVSNFGDERNNFDVDMVINGFSRVEANEDRGIEEHGLLKGCIFNFRKDMLPVEFKVYHPQAIEYFEDLAPSSKNAIFTRIKGSMISKTIVKQTEEESAWGEVSVKKTTSSTREFVVEWAQKEPYEWDSEDTILASELTEMIANREVYLATLKQRANEPRKEAAAFPTSAPASSTKKEYKF